MPMSLHRQAGAPVYGWPNAAVEWTFRHRRVTAGILIAAHVGLLLWMGRPLLCTCGDTLLWQPSGSLHSSQHAADWYSLLHVGFGIAVALSLHWIRPRWRRRDNALVALFCSTVWELVENTPAVIGLLGNAGNVAPDYYGDSLVNSLADSGFVLLGFWIGTRVTLRLGLTLIVAMELAASVAIRDGWLLVALRLTGLVA